MKTTELNNYTFIEFDKGTAGKHHDTQECYMFINKSKNTTYRISFSMAVSEIVKKKKLTKLVLRIDNITGDVYILFSEDPTRKSPTLKFKENKNGLSQMSLCCSEMHKYMTDNLNLEKKVELSEDLAKCNDYATFKILK
jgi:hypothetical protein